MHVHTEEFRGHSSSEYFARLSDHQFWSLYTMATGTMGN